MQSVPEYTQLPQVRPLLMLMKCMVGGSCRSNSFRRVALRDNSPTRLRLRRRRTRRHRSRTRRPARRRRLHRLQVLRRLHRLRHPIPACACPHRGPLSTRAMAPQFRFPVATAQSSKAPRIATLASTTSTKNSKTGETATPLSSIASMRSKPAWNGAPRRCTTNMSMAARPIGRPSARFPRP